MYYFFDTESIPYNITLQCNNILNDVIIEHYGSATYSLTNNVGSVAWENVNFDNTKTNYLSFISEYEPSQNGTMFINEQAHYNVTCPVPEVSCFILFIFLCSVRFITFR